MLRTLLALSLLVGFTAPLAAQNELDGMWFRIKVAAVGFALDGDAETTKPAKLVIPAYVGFRLAEGGPGNQSYAFDVWCETAPGEWSPVFGDTATATTLDGRLVFFVDMYQQLTDKNGRSIQGYCTDLITVKKDKSGDVKSASYRTLGGETISGSTSETNLLLGSQSRKGKSVKVESLPFNPDT